MVINHSTLEVSGQFTPGQFTPGKFTPGQFTPGRFTPRYTLPFTIDLKIITRVNCPWEGLFTREFTPKQCTPGQFTPGQFTPRYTLPFTIDLKIITRGELSSGRTIYPGNSPRNNSPRVILCLLLKIL